MNKKNWLIIAVVVLVVFGIYSVSVNLSPERDFSKENVPLNSISYLAKFQQNLEDNLENDGAYLSSNEGIFVKSLDPPLGCDMEMCKTFSARIELDFCPYEKINLLSPPAFPDPQAIIDNLEERIASFVNSINCEHGCDKEIDKSDISFDIEPIDPGDASCSGETKINIKTSHSAYTLGPDSAAVGGACNAATVWAAKAAQEKLAALGERTCGANGCDSGCAFSIEDLQVDISKCRTEGLFRDWRRVDVTITDKLKCVGSPADGKYSITGSVDVCVKCDPRKPVIFEK